MTTDAYWHFDALSLRADAALIGVGITLFDIDNASTPKRTFYWRVSLEGQRELGRTISHECLDWWRTDAPYKEPFSGAMFSLTEVLERALTVIYEQAPDACRVWVWNAMLEGAVLQGLLDALGFDDVPWLYWNVHEGRTFCDAAALAAGKPSIPAPHGDTPQEQMVIRADTLQEAHARLNMAAPAGEHEDSRLFG